MGSGASSNVRTINIDQAEDDSSPQNQRPGRPWSSVSAFGRKERAKQKDTEIEELKLQVNQYKTIATKETEKSDLLQDKIKALEEQVNSLESGKLDLEEQIQTLQERLEEMHVKFVSEKQSTTSEETLAAKDQYISKLEQQHQTLQDDMKKLRVGHKKRIRKLNSSISETRHEMSLQIFEMKNEIDRLEDENNMLKEQLQSPKQEEDESDTSHPFFLTERCTSSLGNNEESRSRIILELSSRVSEQEEEIIKLKAQLEEKQKDEKKKRTDVSFDKTSGQNLSKKSNLDRTTNNQEVAETTKCEKEAISDSLTDNVSNSAQSLSPHPPVRILNAHSRSHVKQRNFKFTSKTKELPQKEKNPIDTSVNEFNDNAPSSKIRVTQEVISNSTFENEVLNKDKISSKLSTGWFDEEEDLVYPTSQPIFSH